MNKKTLSIVHIFGNLDLVCDALPVRLLPRLKHTFPQITFRFTDPNELDLPEPGSDFIAIDTVDGLKEVREIDIDEIAALKVRSTAHDYDLASYLLLVKKIQKNIGIRIIGIPMHCNEESAFEKISTLLKPLAA